MLHKTRIKCCVRTYTSYFNIGHLLVHLYVVQKTNMLFKNYTTYENVLNNIWQKFVTSYEKISYNIWEILRQYNIFYTTYDYQLDNL